MRAVDGCRGAVGYILSTSALNIKLLTAESLGAAQVRVHQVIWRSLHTQNSPFLWTAFMQWGSFGFVTN